MKKASLILFCSLVPFLLTAQGHEVQGLVHTFENIPLIGAEVKVKSTKKSFFTDSVGHFIVRCYAEDKLIIKARGFYEQRAKISPNTKVVAVNLRIKPGDRQRKYAVGYGYVSEEDLTSAVSGIDTDDASYANYSNIYDLIRDRVAGAQVTNGEIILRGDNSFRGSSAALIVVDGVIVDYDFLNTLSPVQIKSIDAIKDGTSAIYGSRGANGVILIETKKGGDEIR
jgi:TonB-dependent SusC/RagA subfamily outer membrane receptor